jgi:hypothetical protein
MGGCSRVMLPKIKTSNLVFLELSRRMRFLRTSYRGIMLLAFVIAAVVSVAVNVNTVAAEPCTVQLGYSSLSTTQYYYNSNVGITVPVSVSCSSVSGQLYAVGDAYDTSVNTDLGSVNTVLTSVYGGTFNGQLLFSLSSSILSHPVMITVSIYSGSPYGYGSGGNGSLLAQAAQRVQVNLGNNQNGYYQNPYQYGNCYQSPYCYYPGYNYNNGPCQATGNTSTVQCSGFLYDNANGCIELAIPIDNAYWAETRIYQYYTLVNLPSYYALTRSWVTVTGQLYQGYNIGPSSTACSPNYITVTSISP